MSPIQHNQSSLSKLSAKFQQAMDSQNSLSMPVDLDTKQFFNSVNAQSDYTGNKTYRPSFRCVTWLSSNLPTCYDE